VPCEAPPDDLPVIWERVREGLATSLPTATFQLWIEPLRPVSTQEGTLYLTAPPTTRTWVERRYRGALQAALRGASSHLVRVAFVTEGASPSAESPGRPGGASVQSLPLDPGHTFERFVIGSGNRLAHSAALAVAELPGEAYNPLFLHGPPGLGKTHLLSAIVDYLRRQRPELTIHYTTSERFTTEFVGALRKDGPERFKQRYRKLDALLIDDVQVLEGKEHTQEEFVYTFNALHAAGKQIALSSDRPPEALARLTERLRDRFAWGLSVELDSPDLRTRTALLWRMATEGSLELGDPAALKEIAGHAIGNVRRLQGAMTRVTAFSSMLSTPVTPALARQALDHSPETRSAPCKAASPDASPSVESIQEAVCSVLGVTRQDLLSPRRTARVSHARQVAMFLARELTSLSLAQIARAFGRDHTTVLHAVRAVAGRLDDNPETVGAIDRARQLLVPPSDSPNANLPLSHQAAVSPHRPSTDSLRSRPR
jgi:chromosomal replication initiator protein